MAATGTPASDWIVSVCEFTDALRWAGMAYDVARVRGLHPSLGDGWVHFDAQNGMLLPDAVATTVSTAFRGSMPTPVGPHPSARRSAAVLEAARQAVADLVNADPRGRGARRRPRGAADARWRTRRRRASGSATRWW